MTQYVYPDNITDYPVYLKFDIIKFSEKSKKGGIVDTIFLADNNQISIDEPQTWSQDDAGGKLKQASDAVAGDLATFVSGRESMNATEGMTETPDSVGGAVNSLKDSVSGAFIKGGTQNTGFVVVNKLALSYNGPSGQRSFTFNYKFVPKKQGDVEVIKNIIKTFRMRSAPEKVPGDAAFRSYKFPHVFEIEHIDSMTGDLNHHFPRFHTCICKSVSSKFGDSTMTTFAEDNSPTIYELSLSFEEIDINDSNKIAEGF
jgi:hypothetical protein